MHIKMLHVASLGFRLLNSSFRFVNQPSINNFGQRPEKLDAETSQYAVMPKMSMLEGWTVEGINGSTKLWEFWKAD